MTLCERIEQAFAPRVRPTELILKMGSITPEQKDALWFAGRNWQAIRWEDWEQHPDAVHVFLPEAFRYYLPSILSLSAQHPDRWFAPADSLLQVLDRSPTVEYWDGFITSRLFGLQPAEYEVLKEWLFMLSERGDESEEDRLMRALETVDLLQKHTNHVRAMIKPTGNQE